MINKLGLLFHEVPQKLRRAVKLNWPEDVGVRWAELTDEHSSLLLPSIVVWQEGHAPVKAQTVCSVNHTECARAARIHTVR